MPTLATTAFLTDTTPAPGATEQCVVFSDDGGSPTLNISGIDPVMVGDSGSGGKAGNVPHPASGDAAAGKFLKADGTWAVPPGSGTNVEVNGSSALATANLNNTTPAAGSNGKNVSFQVSGTSVSAELVGDGNAAHYLDGTGNYTTPSGGSTAFSAITGATNTSAAMVVGSGASIAPTGTGTVQATNIAGTISAGANVTITGSGTVASPYSIAASGGGGGAGAWMNISGSSQVSVSGATQSASTGGDMEVTGTTTAVVTISSIPNTYLALMLMIWGGADSGTPNLTIIFNGDTGNHYSENGWWQGVSGSVNSLGSASNAGIILPFTSPGSGAAVQVNILVPFYADTNFGKVAQVTIGSIASAVSTANNRAQQTQEGWNNGGTPAAISSITATVDSPHNFAQHTKFVLLALS